MFLNAMGRLPKQHEDFRGNTVGERLTSRRLENKRGVPSGERIQPIQDALGVDVLMPVVDVKLERWLADVAEYQRSRCRLPAQSSDAGRLGVWLRYCRREANSSSLSEVHTQRLDIVLGAEWRPTFKSATV